MVWIDNSSKEKLSDKVKEHIVRGYRLPQEVLIFTLATGSASALSDHRRKGCFCFCFVELTFQNYFCKTLFFHLLYYFLFYSFICQGNCQKFHRAVAIS